MDFRVHGIRYNVNSESVAVAVVPNSPLISQVIDLYTTQQALQQRAVDAGKTEWGDDEVLAEAVLKLAEKDPNATLVLEETEPLPGMASPVVPSKPSLTAVVLSDTFLPAPVGVVNSSTGL
jgi:hypothetical protein